MPASNHDQTVRREANKLRRAGWSVKADLPGFKKPDPIGAKSRIPDIEATKGGATRLIEVETSKSLRSDREQQATFNRSAARRNRTTFKIVETD